MGLMSGPQARTKVAKRVQERTHWIFLVEPSGIPMLRAIEEACYAGEKNADFELIVRADMNSIAMADKRHMTREQLLGALGKWWNISFPIDSSADADIMLLAESATPEHQMAVVRWFQGWVMVQ